jgi:hypothetical protein
MKSIDHTSTGKDRFARISPEMKAYSTLAASGIATTPMWACRRLEGSLQLPFQDELG